MATIMRYQPCPVHGFQPHSVDQPNHGLHLVLTLFTGVWLFVWLYEIVKQRPAMCHACMHGLAAGAPQPRALPAPPEGSVRIKESSTIRDVRVVVVAHPQRGLHINVANDRGVTLRILWDESSCVGPGQRMLGRLIKQGNSMSGTQAASIVAPGTLLSEHCVPEKGLPVNSTGYGKLNLVIETDVGKEAWVASLTFGTPEVAALNDIYR